MNFITSIDVRSRLTMIAAGVFASGALLMTSGCGGSKAANAQTPPPQSLSEPVHAQESTPTQSPSVPSTDGYDYSAQAVGTSRALPPAVMPSSSAQVASNGTPRSGNGTYHTLSKGETIYALSRQYGVKPKEIIAANSFKDPNHLTIGTKVYIPN